MFTDQNAFLKPDLQSGRFERYCWENFSIQSRRNYRSKKMSKKSVSIQKFAWEITEVEMLEAMQRLIYLGSEYEEELAAWKELVVEVTSAVQMCSKKVSKIANVEDPLFQEIRYMVEELLEMADMLENNLISVRSSVFKRIIYYVSKEWYSPSWNNIARAVKEMDLKISQLLIHDGDGDDDEEEKGEDMRYLQAKMNDDVLGFEGYVSELLQVIVGMKIGKEDEVEMGTGGGGGGESGSVSVVGIVGTAGVGKTTLARVVFNMRLIREEFDCRIWINALPSYRHPFRKFDLMVDILQQSLGSPVLLDSSSSVAAEGLDGEYYFKEISNTVRSFMKDKRVLLVLDDIDDEFGVVWESIRDVLPKGSRAILTSRGAASSLPHVIPECGHVLSLAALPKDISWTLFCRNAMHHHHHPLMKPLEVIGRDIVERCGGRPLAIILIARLLSTMKPDPSVWAKVLKRMEVHVSFPGSVHGFLSLSYEYLPCSLRVCITYCSGFPDDFQELPAKKLCRLWLAEGFLCGDTPGPHEETLMEFDAGMYELYQLIWRNLIQPVRVGANGEVETCRLLRPVRDFCTTLMEVSSVDLRQRLHFVSVAGDEDNVPASSSPGPVENLRSLQFLGRNRMMTLSYKQQHYYSNFSSSSLGKFKHLRVLDLYQVQLYQLPENLYNLGNLRYLGFKQTMITGFQSIEALPKLLQTLDIRRSNVTGLPQSIKHLTKLRYLYLSSSNSDKVIPLPRQMDVTKSLLNLRKLTGVEITENLAQNLGKLTHLRKLSGGRVREQVSTTLCTSLNKLSFLSSLALKCEHPERLNLDTLENNYKKNLSKLRLGGQLMTQLDHIALIKSLTNIYVWDSMLDQDQDPLSKLQNLPNLVVLSLCKAYRGRLIKCDPDGFPKLKKLSIIRFSYLEEWGKIEGGAMKCLEELKLSRCPKLHQLPEGLADLDSLQLIQLMEVPIQINKEIWKTKLKRIPRFTP